MKLRYYLRGVGTGILVAVILMGVAFSGQKSSMTDEQIKTRAAELGMVEESLLSEVAEDIQTEQETEPTVSEEMQAPENEQDKKEEPELEQIETEELETEQAEEESETVQTDVEESTEDQSVQPTEVLKVPIMIEVVGGESSVSISKKLEAAGLVTSAKEYDQYLCSNGYDKKISVGNHEIPIDSDFETIAKILTSK
ncbi:MAG: hypothetical protein PHT89_04750 [Lachnospiraceae bacterium]|nr:hypothetical protein [Lachnospiraceae bacterium]MDD3660014.1 hypothetical protein [Lachnospiraceae bacterium]